jgi:dTDP-4-amino-4,6-dideoxygalactose transaminase
MSNLTYQLLNSIDYQHIAEKRVYNFNYIHEQLKKSNQLTLEIEKSAVPMVYPYLPQNGNEIKKKLIQNKIFVATYWPNVITRADKDSYSHYLTNNLVAIPIDQRYNQDDMNKIIEHLK